MKLQTVATLPTAEILFGKNAGALEWPMLWRITMNSLHNEGMYE